MNQKRIWVIVVLGLLLWIFSTERTCGAGRPFITKWQGKKDEALKIPIVGKEYKLVIKKADGTELKIEEKLTVKDPLNPYSYIPAEDGIYTVEAGPENVTNIQFVNNSKGGSAEALLTVEQFGDVKWSTMFQAFRGCKNMTFDAHVDTPDLSQVDNMNFTFRGCSKFDSPSIGDWNVSSVKSMIGTFYQCKEFNQNLNRWDVSHVTLMAGLFFACVKFNQPLSNWDVSHVTNMQSMFMSCWAFAGSLSSWKVGNVTDMNAMFASCHAYNEDLSVWDLKQCRILQLPTGMSNENYDKFLQHFASSTDSPINFTLTALNLKYTAAAKAARTKLINEKHWAIGHDTPDGGDNYGSFLIGGYQVNNENVANLTQALKDAKILKNGTVSLDVSQTPPVLILNNAIIEPMTAFSFGLTGMYPGLTIKLEGENRIENISQGCMSLGKLHIMGESLKDKLIVKGKVFALQIGGNLSPLTIQNCTTEFESTGGHAITGHVQFSSMTIDNAVVKVRSHAEFSPVVSYKSFALNQCKIVYPEGAQFADPKHGVVDAKGDLLLDTWLVIHPDALPYISAKTLKIKPNDVSLKQRETTQLEVIFEPSDATIQEVTWSSSNTDIAEVDETGNVVAKGEGDVVITAISTIDNSIKDVCNVSIKKETAVETVTLAGGAGYPTLFQEQLKIVKESDEMALQFSIFNTQGIKMRSGILKERETVIDTKDLSNGLYILHLANTRGVTKVFRVIKLVHNN